MSFAGKLRKKKERLKAKQAAYCRKDIWAGCIHIVNKYISGRIGTREQHRIREKPTEDKVRRWKDKQAELKVFCLLQENYLPDDLWMTFTYPGKTRKLPEDIRKDVNAFRGRLKRIYRKHGVELLCLGTAGIGSRGGIHLHMVLNRAFEGVEALIEKAWQDTVGTEACPYPMVNTRHLDRSGVWDGLAAYIIKNGKEARDAGTPIYKHLYFYSRNLRRPEVKTTIVKAKEWREDPVVPKGYELLSVTKPDTYWVNGYPCQSYMMKWTGGEEGRDQGRRRYYGPHQRKTVSRSPARPPVGRGGKAEKPQGSAGAEGIGKIPRAVP